MTDIRFYPLGIPVSSSFVARSQFTQASANTPVTASLSGIGMNLTGSIGDSYLIVSASSGPPPNLGLVVGS